VVRAQATSPFTIQAHSRKRLRIESAFFYAGAHSLLVSHWEVASGSTVKLITKAITELNTDPKIGRAGALRRSMLSMISTGKDYEAHPALWAPFDLAESHTHDRFECLLLLG
jgi:CHAT domain-containing protein